MNPNSNQIEFSSQILSKHLKIKSLNIIALKLNWNPNCDKIREKAQKTWFLRFFSHFFRFLQREFGREGPTLWKYFWQNSETIFVTKFFSRTRIMYNSWVTPYRKLSENQLFLIINSFKINENQWNLNQILAKIELFLNNFEIKFRENIVLQGPNHSFHHVHL